MDENPVFYVLLIAAGVYAAHLWWTDYNAARSGQVVAQAALPGATPASLRAVLIAAAGGALILAAETAGEIALGLDSEQSKMTVIFGIYTLVAALIEEIIFRGYLVVEKRGRAALIGGIVGASVLFALLHPFLWEWDMGQAAFWQIVQVWRWPEWLTLTLTPKGWFSFGAVLLASLWFYACRFATWNPTRSLLPCFAAHFTKNAGVFVIKAVQGFVVGVW